MEASDDIRFLAPEDVHALAAAVIDGSYEQIDRALYLTAAMTGMRLGELRALRWRDVDWHAGQVRVRRSYVRGEYTTPKSRHGRAVPLADDVARALDRLAQSARIDRDDDLVFADPATGEPLNDRALLRRYRRALAGAGLDVTLRFHDLRHTFGTRMAAGNVPLRTLQQWMGHANIATTEIYAHYAPRHDEREMVQAAFRGTNRGTNLSESQVI